MGVSVFDSILLRQLWGTDELYAIFCDETKLQKWFDFEAALALEQAAMGIIPKEAADDIAAQCNVSLIKLENIAAGIRAVKHRLVPTLHEVQKLCKPGNGEWIHYGPTTQDVLDTGLMLQIKDTYALLLRDLKAVGRELYRLSETYRDTPMAGRTHGVQALPITFGHKCAIWLREMARHQQRLTQAQERILVGSMCGAVGTMASFGDRAFELEERVMKRLGLGVADISWASARDRLAEFTCLLGLIGGTLGKIANEIFNMQRSEFGELEEPFTPGKVGSSTMPHKRNPTVIENVITAGRILRYNVSIMQEAMVQENERDGAAWKTEWKVVPECCLLTGAMLAQTKFVLSGLVVNVDEMRKNLDMLGGYILSEKIMFLLSDKVGKQTAHELIYQASMFGQTNKLDFFQALLTFDKTRDLFTEEELREALDPAHYVGHAPRLVDRALKMTRDECWLNEDA